MGDEIVTLGIGNYGVLAAAHWANSTTRYDSEHRVVFSDSRGGATVRLLLLDHAQPSRVRKTTAMDDPNAMHEPTDVAPEDEDDYDYGADPELTDDANFTWTWDTATRHPAQVKHQDPAQDAEAAAAAASDEAEADEEADCDPLEKELAGAPPLNLTPWWRYISVPTNSEALLTNVHFDDPIGGLLTHSFGFGLHQSFDDGMSGVGRSQGRMTGLDLYGDRLRRQLEASDHAQGLQIFVDGDSAFGGVACALLRHLRDDFEDVRATFAHTAFPVCDFPSDSDFAKRRKEEVILNRALCVTHLAEYAAVFTPYEMRNWSLPHLHSIDNNDDVTTAAIMAATSDTALYAARQRAAGPESFRPLGETAGLLRTSESMRLVSAACSLPFFVPTPERSAYVRSKPQDAGPSLWSVLNGSPLLGERWSPLTHAYRGAEAVELDSGRVEAHVFAGRGLAGFADVEYPRQESVLRYVFPMRTSRYAADLFAEPYPVSNSFPVDRCFGVPKVVTVPGNNRIGEATGGLANFKLGAHLVNSFQSACYTRSIVSEAEPVMRYAKHTHGAAYGFEADEWRESLETLHAVHDAYDHEGAIDDGDDDLED